MAEHPSENTRLTTRMAPTPLLHAGFRDPAVDPALAAGEEGISLHDMLGILRRHIGIVLGVAALVTMAAALFAYTRPSLYQATATIALANNREALTGGIADGGVEGVALGAKIDPLLSQLEILTSRRVLGEVVQKEGLRLRVEKGALPASSLQDVRVAGEVERDTIHVEFRDDVFVATSGAASQSAAYGRALELEGVRFAVSERPEESEAVLAVVPPRAAIEALRNNLEADPREPTNVVDVQYTSTDPKVAQRVANAVVETFRDVNAQSAQQQSRRRREFLEVQMAQTDSMLREAQLALSGFRSREEVYSSGEKMAAQQTGLMGLGVRREEMRADRDMYQSLLDGLVRGNTENRFRALRTLVSSPGIASNAVVSQTYASLVQYELQRDTLTAGVWGSAETSPDVQRLDALIASTEAKLLDAVRSHITALDARIAALNELEARSAAEIRGLPTAEAEEQWLVQQLHTIQSLADNLRGEYQKARMAEAVEAGQVEVVDTALLPRRPVGSGPLSQVFIGFVLGLMLGCGGALLAENLNTSIRHRDEMESTLRIPGLAVIPQIAAQQSGPRRLRLPFPVATNGDGNGNSVGHGHDGPGIQELVTVSDARSSGSEAYRTLRTNLIFSQAIQSLRTLAITSSGPAEGKTVTVANLAVTFAQQGMRVLVVDGDLRKARMHFVFGAPREPGLTHLILGYNALEEVVHPTAVENLFILPAGALPPNPSELLGGDRMREALTMLQQQFDLVLVDTPPLLAAADAAVVGTACDGVLMVVRAGHTNRAAARQAVQQLHGVGARVVGAVLNDPDAQAANYGGYYYHGYYGSET